MSVIQWPGFETSAIRWSKVNQAVVSRGAFGGSQSTEGASPLWEVELSGVPQYWAGANRMLAFLESLDCFRNQIELWNLAQPYPAGTMRGTMVVDVAASAGATTLLIHAAGEAQKTLLAGDLIGFGTGLSQQVVRISADAISISSGQIFVTIGTPLRAPLAVNDPVRWNRPKALFRQKSLNEGIEYQSIVGQPWSLSLIEDPRP